MSLVISEKEKKAKSLCNSSRRLFFDTKYVKSCPSRIQLVLYEDSASNQEVKAPDECHQLHQLENYHIVTDTEVSKCVVYTCQLLAVGESTTQFISMPCSVLGLQPTALDLRKKVH